MKAFLYIIGFVSGLILTAGYYREKVPRPTLYECPCEASELIEDEIRHANKNGAYTATTFINVKDCILVNQTK